VTNGYADALPIDALGATSATCTRSSTPATPVVQEIATKGTDKKAWNDLTSAMKAVLGEFGREFAPDTAAVA
jgi:hypothetical protein